MRWVLLYEAAPDVLERAPEDMPAHMAVIEDLHERGLLLQVGIFEDPVANGSMTVLTSREAAEEMIARDPFVTEGLAASYRILGWDEVYARGGH